MAAPVGREQELPTRSGLPLVRERTLELLTPDRSAGSEYRLKIDFLSRCLKFHAAFNVVQVLEHQSLGTHRVALGDCIDDL